MQLQMIDMRDDVDQETPDPESVTANDLIEIVERIMELDERRQSTLRDEFEAGADSFTETRDVLTAERRQLAQLEASLSAEAEHLSKLVEGSDHLTVEQAVRNRNQSIEKIRKHNEELSRFHEEMEALLTVVETNVERIETDGTDAELKDSRVHLEAAIEAIRTHNESVDGLDTNLRILGAYLT